MNLPAYRVACAALFACVAVSAAGQDGQTAPRDLSVPAQAIAFELDDQFGETHEVQFPSDRVTFLILADRKGSDEVEAWIRAMYEAYEDRIAIAGVAKLEGAPRPLRGMIRKLFRRGVDYPVMMDWTGDVCDSYGYTANHAHVFVIGPDGTIELSLTGPSEDDRVHKVRQTIDALLDALEHTPAGDSIPK